jgi:alpha,alpha-trehalase
MIIAAYQVGLTFLTSHMRRAVATCTSPEMFFGPNVSGLAAGSSAVADNLVLNDPLNLAMGSLDITAGASA